MDTSQVPAATPPLKVAVVGAGWAGLAAAVEATRHGHHVTLLEAARTLGGRARAVNATLPDGSAVVLDNGQHILIGAYAETLALMRDLGLQTEQAFCRLPLELRFPENDGRKSGLQFPDWPTPLDALAGILRAGWSWPARLGLLRTAWRWQRMGFRCPPAWTVAELCHTLAPQVQQELIEPLCLSALNTPPQQASAQVFLRVLQDALFGAHGGSNLLLPRADLGALFPQLAADRLLACGGRIQFGQRAMQLRPHTPDGRMGRQPAWQLDDTLFDAVLLATPPGETARLLEGALRQPHAGRDTSRHSTLTTWIAQARALQFEAITTVYAWATNARLPRPMLALRATTAAPAQFVFDRGQLGGPAGLLAFVISSSRGDGQQLQRQVLHQAQTQLGLKLTPVQTIVEKRATFACMAGLQRPPATLGPGLFACADYIDGPYPATLEGAVRSGLTAARMLKTIPAPAPACPHVPTKAPP